MKLFLYTQNKMPNLFAEMNSRKLCVDWTSDELLYIYKVDKGHHLVGIIEFKHKVVSENKLEFTMLTSPIDEQYVEHYEDVSFSFDRGELREVGSPPNDSDVVRIAMPNGLLFLWERQVVATSNGKCLYHFPYRGVKPGSSDILATLKCFGEKINEAKKGFREFSELIESLYYSPGMPGYDQAKSSFESRQNPS